MKVVKRDGREEANIKRVDGKSHKNTQREI